MNEMERIALEREFEDKSGRLTEMMLQMSDMQTAYRKWEAASRANAVMAAYEAMTAENDEVARMQKHVDRAAEESKNAASSGAKELAQAAKAAANAQQLALNLAKEKQASELKRKYFGPDGELYKKRESLMAPIQDEIYNAVKDICDQKGYQLVLDRASGGNIIYASPKIDISDEILTKLGYAY